MAATNPEFYLDHEVRIRMQELCYKQLNRKLDIILAIVGGICSVVIIPIALHAFNLI